MRLYDLPSTLADVYPGPSRLLVVVDNYPGLDGLRTTCTPASAGVSTRWPH